MLSCFLKAAVVTDPKSAALNVTEVKQEQEGQQWVVFDEEVRVSSQYIC